MNKAHTTTLEETLKTFGPEAKAFWSKKAKGPDGQKSPYEVALSLVGKTKGLSTALLAFWFDLGCPR